MLFNSWQFICVFLPIVITGYFYLNSKRLIVAANSWLVLASLFFYGFWNPQYLLLILVSILVNYGLGNALYQRVTNSLHRKSVLLAGILLNLGILGYYKYTGFFLSTVNAVCSFNMVIPTIVLPLGISFFTFQQMTYVVDSYYGKAKEQDFLNYCLFVLYFPQLIAGPIVHHSEMMPQFADVRTKIFRWKHFSLGLFLFAIGLFKKVVLADSLAPYVASGFDTATVLDFSAAWGTALSYTFQLYFDFSGYTDMAMGVASMMNITLPFNFNSPYKACDIQDFWRRWHMTLSRFLRDYIYIPLGGNRSGDLQMLRNVIVTFLLGGIWHGAGWTFMVWGLWHGIGMALFLLWKRIGKTLPRVCGWMMTFFYVIVGWVFFRAHSFHDAFKVLKGMCGGNGFNLPHFIARKLDDFGIIVGKTYFGSHEEKRMFILIAISLVMILVLPNSNAVRKMFRPTVGYAALFIGMVLTCIIYMVYIQGSSEFLYFQF